MGMPQMGANTPALTPQNQGQQNRFQTSILPENNYVSATEPPPSINNISESQRYNPAESTSQSSQIDYNNLPAGIDANAVRANPQGYIDYRNATQPQAPTVPATDGGAGTNLGVTQAQPSIFGQSAGAYTDALGATRAGLGVQPNNIRAAQVRAGQVGTNDISQGMSQYQNPYEQQVVDNAMKDIERQRQMQVNQVGSQATAAGAFGGSRQGVAEAETNRAALEQQANTAAQLRSQGFAQAADLAGRDIQNRQNVDLANQSANLGASTFNAGQLMQSQLANQSNLNQYANRLMSGGSQLGSLSNLGFNMGNTLNQNQMQAGNQQQALMQALINAGRNQTQNYYNSPQDALNTLIGAYSGSQTGQQSQQNTKTPGLFDFLSLGMQL